MLDEGYPPAEDSEAEEEENQDMPEDQEMPEQAEFEAPKRKLISGANGRRYPKKMKPHSNFNLEEALLSVQEVRKNISTAFCTMEEMPDTAIEMAFPYLENEHQIRKYLRNPEAFVVNNIRKRRVEVNEKRLTPSEKELMRTAKGKEVKEFIKEQVITRLKEGENPSEEDIMKMRWVLTWKKNEDGCPKGQSPTCSSRISGPTFRPGANFSTDS